MPHPDTDGKRSLLARFSRTLATLLASGVQLLQAMEIGKNVLENARLEQVVSEAIGSIREGESIAVPLKRSGQFPPMMTHMIAVGEKSGQLEPMLENVSRAYEADVETRVVALTSLLEPIMIVALGGAVVPEAWRGGLPITYHFGPGPAKVRLKVEFDWKLVPAMNVVARIVGSERPDQWILRGNHHDAWVNGAEDPVVRMVEQIDAPEIEGSRKLVEARFSATASGRPRIT